MERSKHFAGIASLSVLTSGIGLTSATAVSLVFTGGTWTRDVVVIIVHKEKKGKNESFSNRPPGAHLLYLNAPGEKAKNLPLDTTQPKLKRPEIRFNIAKIAVRTRHRLSCVVSMAETVGLEPRFRCRRTVRLGGSGTENVAVNKLGRSQDGR